MLRAAIIAAAVVLSGCGAARDQTPVEPVASRGSDDEVVCKSETPVGSHLPQTRCRRRADIEREREATRRDLDRP